MAGHGDSDHDAKLGSAQDAGPDGDGGFAQTIRVRRRGIDDPRLVHPRSLRAEGELAVHEGELDRAHTLLARAVSIDPNNAPALESYGRALRAEGRTDDAIALLRRAVLIDGQLSAARLLLGQLLVERGRFDEATSELEALLGARPAQTTARLWLGRALAGLGRLEPALRALKTAARQDPSDFDALIALARVLHELGNPRQALGALNRAARLRSADPQVHLINGWILLGAGGLHRAEAAFRQALWVDPDASEAVAGLAAVADREGDLGTAVARMLPFATPKRAGVQLAVRFAAVAVRAELVPKALALVHAVLSRPLTARERSALRFAEGDLYDALDDHPRAIAAWTRGNELLQRRFEPSSLRSLVDGMRRTYSSAAFHSLPRSRVDGRPLVFIVGFPRAGAGLLDAVLSAHPDVCAGGRRTELQRVADRLPVLLGATYPECVTRLDWAVPDRLADQVLDPIRRGSTTATHLTLCRPLDLTHLGLIAQLFPGARVIMVRRDARDACLAAFRYPFHTPEHAFSSRIDHLAAAWGEYERLARHWRDALPLEMIEVRYEDMVSDLEGSVRGVLEFLRLPFHAACLDTTAVRERHGRPGLSDAPQPLSSAGIGRWRPYAAWLGPVMQLDGDSD